MVAGTIKSSLLLLERESGLTSAVGDTLLMIHAENDSTSPMGIPSVLS